jgi:hypothetical protein
MLQLLFKQRGGLSAIKWGARYAIEYSHNLICITFWLVSTMSLSPLHYYYVLTS